MQRNAKHEKKETFRIQIGIGSQTSHRRHIRSRLLFHESQTEFLDESVHQKKSGDRLLLQRITSRNRSERSTTLRNDAVLSQRLGKFRQAIGKRLHQSSSLERKRHIPHCRSIRQSWTCKRTHYRLHSQDRSNQSDRLQFKSLTPK